MKIIFIFILIDFKKMKVIVFVTKTKTFLNVHQKQILKDQIPIDL